MARNALALSSTPSDRSVNSSNLTQTIDSEQNITPIEEHVDIGFAHGSNTANTPIESGSKNLSTARDITKRIESFSKGIMETLKFDKRSTNPFEFEIEIGATEIHPKDLIKDNDSTKTDQMSKINGNNRGYLKDFGFVKSDDGSIDINEARILEIFEHKTASMFHTLLPLTFGHIAALANSDPRSSVEILTLIREILPHVAALNKISSGKDLTFGKLLSPIQRDLSDEMSEGETIGHSNTDQVDVAHSTNEAVNSKPSATDLITTSNHYCIVESDHPYKAASINNYK